MTALCSIEHDAPHEWARVDGSPLICLRCGLVWPGEVLPEPYMSRNPGYGALEGFVPWGERVDRMISELGEVA